MSPVDPQNERLKALIRQYRECPTLQARQQTMLALQTLQQATLRLQILVEMEPFFMERIHSFERRRGSRQHKLWYLDICEDALSQFKAKLFEKDFYGYDESKAFNPKVGREKLVINWFRLKLAGITSDLYKSEKRRKDREISEFQIGEDGKPQSIFDQISDKSTENCYLDDEATISPEKILVELMAWIKSAQCPPEILKPMKSHPTVTGRDITLCRLDGQTWREMGQELRVKDQTLHSHYRRKCKPHLIKFWQKQKWEFEE